MKKSLQNLLSNMWEDYIEITPDAESIYSLFSQLNDGLVVNDHIALRTFDIDKVSLDKIAQDFIAEGYRPCDSYQFPNKKLKATHFEHPDDSLETPYPKVFISELKVDELSHDCSLIIQDKVDQIPILELQKIGFCYSGRPWIISTHEYQILAKESEYAAWVAAHGFRPNHFTISVNHLKSHQTLESVNKILTSNGYSLNKNGGLIKGSPDVFLEQSSTLAKNISVQFSDGVIDIPGCYYEFALRYRLPNGKLYQGFVANSADKIFESTNLMQSNH